jgi:hypothetical protein
MSVNTNQIKINTSTGEIIYGSEDVNDSWKISIVSNEFTVQKRSFGTWIDNTGISSLSYRRMALWRSNYTSTNVVIGDPFNAFNNENYNDTTFIDGGVLVNHCYADLTADPGGSILFLSGGYCWMIQSRGYAQLVDPTNAYYRIQTAPAPTGPWSSVGLGGYFLPMTISDNVGSSRYAIYGFHAIVDTWVRIICEGSSDVDASQFVTNVQMLKAP